MILLARVIQSLHEVFWACSCFCTPGQPWSLDSLFWLFWLSPHSRCCHKSYILFSDLDPNNWWFHKSSWEMQHFRQRVDSDWGLGGCWVQIPCRLQPPKLCRLQPQNWWFGCSCKEIRGLFYIPVAKLSPDSWWFESSCRFGFPNWRVHSVGGMGGGLALMWLRCATRCAELHVELLKSCESSRQFWQLFQLASHIWTQVNTRLGLRESKGRERGYILWGQQSIGKVPPELSRNLKKDWNIKKGPA